MGFSAAASSGVSKEHGSGGSAAAVASGSSLLLLGLPPAGGAAAADVSPEELAVLPAALGSAGASGAATLNSCSQTYITKVIA
jgi:hypothetical protein